MKKKFLLIVMVFLVCAVILGKSIETYMSGVLDHPTKCFSCERQFSSDMAWMGQNTKCFSCEQDLIARTGNVQSAFDAHPIKYY